MRNFPQLKMLLPSLISACFLAVSGSQALASEFLVDRNDDDPTANSCTALPGDCSLRGAIARSEADPGNDLVTFDPAVFSIGSTVLLASRLVVNGNGSLIIDGSSARLVTLDAQGRGGVLFVGPKADVSLTSVSITGGSLNLSFGGGIDNRGVLSVSHSAIYNNLGSSGGGIFNNGGFVSIRNSTLCFNRSSYGGAVHAVGSGSVTTIADSTLCGNTAIYGGGIYVSSGSVVLGNTIVSNNTASTGGPDIWRNISSLGFNLFGNSSGMVITAPGPEDQLDSDPLLDPAGLSDNGGNSLTVSLLPGSPAIDNGNSVEGTDQRHRSRPVDHPDAADGNGNLSDIGAFEVQAPAPPPPPPPPPPAPVPTYEFGGFLPPIGNGLNRARAGSAIPVKFSLNGFHGFDIFSDGSPSSVETDCNSGARTGMPEPIGSPGNSGLSYSKEGDFYSIVWKSERAWTRTCRRLVVELDDGSVHEADFQFR